jgi:hypothetical protein
LNIKPKINNEQLLINNYSLLIVILLFPKPQVSKNRDWQNRKITQNQQHHQNQNIWHSRLIKPPIPPPQPHQPRKI